MAIINFAHREITGKVVYFGAPGAGCNTNVRQLHELLPVDEKSRLHAFGPEDQQERSWYFDYVPEGGGEIEGFSVRFRVYSIPGGLTHQAHRSELLKGTDAVVFVSDARPNREQANLDSLLDLERALKEQGVEMAAIPMVLQVNHTDDSDARGTEEVVFDLNPYGFPVVAAVAKAAKGVLETHDGVTRVTVSRIRENLAGHETAITLTAVHRATRERDEDIIQRHLAAIERAERHARRAGSDDTELRLLPVEHQVELPFQPRDLAGTKPVRLLDADIDGGDILLDVVVERVSGGEARRLKIHLANRPSDAAGTFTRASTVSNTTPMPRITESLPDYIEIAPPKRTDFPPVWYGVAGLAGGVLIGLLVSVLVLM